MKPRKTKDSGIPWIGQIPEGWTVRRLKRTSDLVVDKCPPINEDEGDGLMYVGLEHVESQSGRLIDSYKPIRDFSGDTIRFEKGNVLFGKLRPYLAKCWLADTAGKCSSEFFVLKPNDECVGVFLHWTMLSSRFVDLIDGSTYGVKMPRAEWSFVGNIHMPFPAVPEQERTAAYLDEKCGEIDRVIAAKERQNELLKAQRTAIISETVTKGLNPKTKFKDSGIEWIGMIPATWSTRRIKLATKLLRGKFSYRPRNEPSLYDGQYPFIQTGDVANANGYICQYTQTLNELGLSVSTLFPKNTLVMTIAANIGDVAILDFDACFPDSIIGFVPSRDILGMKYLFYVFKAMKEELLSLAPVNTQGNLNIERVGNMPFPLPSPPEQEQISAYLDSRCGEIDRVMAANEEMVTKLKAYRSSVIWEAVTGKNCL